MGFESSKVLAVCGATGRQGGAVVRHALKEGWRVRALTRSPQRAKARSLGRLGAEVVAADMSDPRSLERAFDGAHGVYSVQNPMISGLEEEVVQGRNVGTAAKAAGVGHLVYGSAGVGQRTGVGSWDSKLPVEEHLAALGLAVTVLRPMAFMELMSDKAFYPPLSTWYVMPKLMGSTTSIPWLAVDDLGAIAVKVFSDPARFAGRTLALAADVQSLESCRAIWTEVRGRPPRRFPMPVAAFERVASADLATMWRWLRTRPVPLDTSPTREIHPEALTVRDWLRGRAAPADR